MEEALFAGQKLIALQYNGILEYVKVPYSFGCFPVHEEILFAARKHWNIGENINLNIKDFNGIILSDAIFDEYVKSCNYNIHFLIITPVAPVFADISNNHYSFEFENLTPSSSISEATTVTNNSEEAEDSENWKKPDFMEINVYQDLLTYFKIQKNILVNGTSIITAYKKNKKLLDTERKAAIQIVADHLLQTRPHPRKEEKILWAKATIRIFPNLRAKEIGLEGFETVYNPVNKGGWLGNRLKTLNKRKLKGKKTFDNPECTTIQKDNTASIEENASNAEELKQIVQYLKTADPKSDKDNIFSGMQDTFTLRRKLVSSSESSLIFLEYPRFLDTFGLIHNEFEFMFPDSHNNFKNCLNENLLALAEKTAKEYSRLKYIEEFKYWQPEIVSLFYFISLLPPTQKGRAAKNRCGISKCFERIIKFIGANENIDLVQQPTIFAQGSSKLNIVKFYVCVDNKLLPTCNTFYDALDILFKIHFICNIKYDQNLDNFYTYIQNYIFKIPSKNLSSTVMYCHSILYPDLN